MAQSEASVEFGIGRSGGTDRLSSGKWFHYSQTAEAYADYFHDTRMHLLVLNTAGGESFSIQVGEV